MPPTQSPWKSCNLQMDHVVGMEELIGKDGNFEEIGASQMITCSGIVHAVEKTQHSELESDTNF